jgi:hypothetical protein
MRPFWVVLLLLLLLLLPLLLLLFLLLLSLLLLLPGAVAFATMLADDIRNHAHLRDGVRHMHRSQQAATMLGQIVNSLGRRILLLPISSIGKLISGGL